MGVVAAVCGALDVDSDVALEDSEVGPTVSSAAVESVTALDEVTMAGSEGVCTSCCGDGDVPRMRGPDGGASVGAGTVATDGLEVGDWVWHDIDNWYAPDSCE